MTSRASEKKPVRDFKFEEYMERDLTAQGQVPLPTELEL